MGESCRIELVGMGLGDWTGRDQPSSVMLIGGSIGLGSRPPPLRSLPIRPVSFRRSLLGPDDDS